VDPRVDGGGAKARETRDIKLGTAEVASNETKSSQCKGQTRNVEKQVTHLIRAQSHVTYRRGYPFWDLTHVTQSRRHQLLFVYLLLHVLSTDIVVDEEDSFENLVNLSQLNLSKRLFLTILDKRLIDRIR
jgi:hypothetical protein